MTMQMHTLSKLVSKTLIISINLLPSMPVRRDWCIFLRTALWSEFCKNCPKLQIHAKDISVFFFFFGAFLNTMNRILQSQSISRKIIQKSVALVVFCKIASYRHPKCKIQKTTFPLNNKSQSKSAHAYFMIFWAIFNYRNFGNFYLF